MGDETTLSSRRKDSSSPVRVQVDKQGGMTPRAGGFFFVLFLAREFLLHILRFHTVVARVQIRLEHGVAHGRVPGRTPPTESGRGPCLEETTKEG